MGMLSSTEWTRHKYVKIKFRLFITEPHSTIRRRVKTENANIPTQQSQQNIKPNLPAQPALHRPIRQPNKINVKPLGAHPKSAAAAKKPNNKNPRDNLTGKALSAGPAQQQTNKNLGHFDVVQLENT